jgi:hypothetical protein
MKKTIFAIAILATGLSQANDRYDYLIGKTVLVEGTELTGKKVYVDIVYGQSTYEEIFNEAEKKFGEIKSIIINPKAKSDDVSSVLRNTPENRQKVIMPSDFKGAHPENPHIAIILDVASRAPQAKTKR